MSFAAARLLPFKYVGNSSFSFGREGCFFCHRDTKALTTISQNRRVPAVDGGHPLSCESLDKMLIIGYNTYRNTISV
jgi:hypothetical protein